MSTIETPAIVTPEAVLANLDSAFTKGKESGDLLFFDSTVSSHLEAGIDFEIRHCPALLYKPPLPTPHFNATKKPADPFAPPYAEGLLLGELEGEEDARYIIMLNKYSVVKHHFLLITKDFQSQTTPPLPPDLVAAYQLMQAARKSGQHFFAFFNCGDRSGASQAHKHLQLIPTDADGPPIEKAAKSQNVEVETTPFSIGSLPYAHYIRRFPYTLQHSTKSSVEELSQTLSDAFMSLLDLAITAIRHDPSPDIPKGPPNYNLILTLSHMHVIPRAREKHVLEGTGEATSVNSLGFAGMLLVKSEEEGDAVKEEGILKILRGVGVPRIDAELTEPQNREYPDAELAQRL